MLRLISAGVLLVAEQALGFEERHISFLSPSWSPPSEQFWTVEASTGFSRQQLKKHVGDAALVFDCNFRQ